jgi:hypothetical protein
MRIAVISVLVLVVYTAGLALWVRFMLRRGMALADGPEQIINELLADFEASLAHAMPWHWVRCWRKYRKGRGEGTV